MGNRGPNWVIVLSALALLVLFILVCYLIDAWDVLWIGLVSAAFGSILARLFLKRTKK